MVKHILVPVDGTPSDERALAAAFDLAGLFTAHVDVLHAHPDSRENLRLIGEGFSAEMLDTMLVEAERTTRATADRARHAFDHAVTMAGAEVAERRRDGGGVTASWREEVGWPAVAVAAAGRLADLVLFAQAAGNPQTMTLLEAALFDTGRPVLLTSAAAGVDAYRSVAIGWDGSLPAVRAITAAMPFLRRAADVSILTVEEGTERMAAAHATQLVEHLGWHGIDAVVRPAPRQDRTVGEALVAATLAAQAGLLVMGGYAHSRFREMILGGATRHVLGTPLACSVLLAH
ncbi:universal stress protein [Azospirillum sp.]|uniref:universal stress protein n=1 Tax=Azospirillum sp. TaxID=34012 RepID=UPI003D732FFF